MAAGFIKVDPDGPKRQPPAGRMAVTPSPCRHKFIFLRSETKNIGFDRNPEYLVEDVFFCEQCLEYRRVATEKQTPKRDEFGNHVEKLT